MAEVHVLVEGYVKDRGQAVQGTVALVNDEGHHIITDPGMTLQPDAIAQALSLHRLSPSDIDTVFITHHHPNHTWHMGLFPEAKLIDFNSTYQHEQWVDFANDYPVTGNVRVVSTPGRTRQDATLLVCNVANLDRPLCTVAVCHLWLYKAKTDDPTAENINELRTSRKLVADLADYVVPGHGPMFAINKEKP